MTLYIKDFIDGDTAISYDDGNKCLKEILKAVDNKEEVIFLELITLLQHF